MALLGQALLASYHCFQRDELLIVTTQDFPDQEIASIVPLVGVRAFEEARNLPSFHDQEDEEDHDGEYSDIPDDYDSRTAQ